MNVYAPYLMLDEARAIVEDAVISWDRSEHEVLATSEGWGISNLLLDDRRQIDTLTDAGIERFDEPWEHPDCLREEPFEGDEAVVEMLRARVEKNEDVTGAYAKALGIEHALNSLRFHLWGEKWVDSRSGPDSDDMDDLRHGTTFDHDRAMDGLAQMPGVAG